MLPFCLTLCAGGAPVSSTTLWVGKIAATIEPRLMHALLGACGPLKEWKPATDAATGTIKGFGFATYQQAEGVLVALAVLNGLTIDGQALALKCNSVRSLFSLIHCFSIPGKQEAADVHPSFARLTWNAVYNK